MSAEPAQAHPHVYLSTSCLHGEMVLPDGRNGHEYCKSEANPTGPKIPSVCKFCQAPCTCPCHTEEPTLDEILSQAAQAARKFGVHQGTALPGLMAHLFDLAASDLAMCERQNSVRPDLDGKTRIMPQPFVSLAVDMAKEALRWWTP